ncbi:MULTISPECIES: class I SAM-dependent methyltransferase [Bacillaceae]|nr:MULTISPECIES: class I SAM-dependent methyltransferase [Bacillaceae]
MFTISDFQNLIEQQLFHNRNKSLFYELTNGRFVLNSSKETSALFKQKSKDIANFIETAHLNDTTQKLAKYISDKTIRLFVEVNQYLNFSQKDYLQLQKVYEALLQQVYEICNQKEVSEEEIDQLFRSHYKNLQSFLLDSNGKEIFKKYRESPDVLEIKCAEYTSEFQMRLLGIYLSKVKQPVLDIGCGQQANLVHFLRKNDIVVYGLDRNVQNLNNKIYQVDWLEYTYVPDTWGTVISHMAFSNHFMHHHLRPDGDYEKYATKYMEILKSLKIGGSFIYAPGLSFMEEILISTFDSYTVETGEYSTMVTRIN